MVVRSIKFLKLITQKLLTGTDSRDRLPTLNCHGRDTESCRRLGDR